MVTSKQLLTIVKRLKDGIKPPPEEVIELYYPTLNETITITFREFDQAEHSTRIGQPNELAQKLLAHKSHGHIDDAGLVHFLFDVKSVWEDFEE